MTDASQIPAGWYADPENPGAERWWNGMAWTDDRRPAPQAAAPAEPAHETPAEPATPTHETPAAPSGPDASASAATQAAPGFAAPGGGSGYAAPGGYASAAGGAPAASGYPAYPTAPAASGYPAYPTAPGYGAYPTAPAEPEIRRDIPTNTVWIWLIVFVPIVSALPLFFFDWTGYVQQVVIDSIQSPSTSWAAGMTGGLLLISALGYLVIAAQILFAWLDWRTLKKRGVERPFHWAWIFLTLVVSNGVYVIGRGVILRKRTGSGLAPVWAWIAFTVASIIGGIIFSVYLLNAVFALVPLIEQYSSYSTF